VYLTPTMLDIMYVVSLVSKLMESTKDSHWHVVKRIFRYIVGATLYGILCSSTISDFLIGYIDYYFSSSIDDMKSTSRYLFYIGPGMISWESNKHPIVTITSSKAEYVATIAKTFQVE